MATNATSSSDRKVVAVGTIKGSFGDSAVKVEQLKRGRFAGRFVTRGGGFAGRVAYSTVERAMRSVEAHAHFVGWHDTPAPIASEHQAERKAA